MSATAHEDRLATLIAAKLRAFESPILTTAEAIAYTKHESDSAFYRWCERWAVRSEHNGRWARRWLDRALQREAASGSNRRQKKAA